MGCGCGKKKGQQFDVTLADGTTSTFGSRLQAEAFVAKNGGEGTIQPRV